MMDKGSFEHKCNRCNYEWKGKLENPKTCPKCNSPYWNKPRTKRLPFHQVPTRFQINEEAIAEHPDITLPSTKKYSLDSMGRDFIHNQVYLPNDRPIAWIYYIDSTSRCSKCDAPLLGSEFIQLFPKEINKKYCQRCAEY